MGAPKCEVCQKEAVVQIWDVQRRPDYRTGVINIEHYGLPHIFCADHKRDSIERDGPPINYPYFRPSVE